MCNRPRHTNVNDDGEDEIVDSADENDNDDDKNVDDWVEVDELTGSTSSTILRPNLQ